MDTSRNNKKPTPKRLVIGVDVGMTFTGVAHFTNSDSKPTVLQDGWPGADGIRNKVPTIIVYNQSSSKQKIVSSWGFLALDEDELFGDDKRRRSFFKLCFDEDFMKEGETEGHTFPFTHSEVCQFYKDYLSKLYSHIQSHYKSTKPHFWKSNVHFVFSVPTTWINPKTIDNLKKIAYDAGFGKEPNHSLEISLTEAHAAAVATAKELDSPFEKNQVILVCDAGGGTTDTALLRVENPIGSPLKLTCLDTVRGDAAGSTAIDRDFRKVVEGKLNEINQDCIADGKDPPVLNTFKTAEKMSAHRTFIVHKESLGPEELETNVKFRMPVEYASKFPNEKLARRLGFVGNKYCCCPKDLAILFDKQIESICQTLDKQFDRICSKAALRNTTIDYIILSGGLGSSKYVFDKLEDRYASLQVRSVTKRSDAMATGYLKCIPNLIVLKAEQPQLVVCKGLVIDKMAQLKGEQKPIDSWVARESYGIVSIRPYVKYKDDVSDIIVGDEILDKTGTKWVEVIRWVVDKGESLSINDKKSFTTGRRFLSHEDASEDEWVSNIVSSDCEPDERPKRLTRPGWKRMCILKSKVGDIRAEDLEIEKRSFMPGSTRKTHYRASYEIVMHVGPAEVNFELWYKGEKKSRLGNVEIEWGRDRIGDEMTQGGLLDIFSKLGI